MLIDKIPINDLFYELLQTQRCDLQMFVRLCNALCAMITDPWLHQLTFDLIECLH